MTDHLLPPPGLYLAMDTSGRVGSVALGELRHPPDAPGIPRDPGNPDPTASLRLNVLSRASLEEREEHASLLVPRIRETMDEVGAGKEELVGLVVGAGPGSFTGVRVGAATAKGLSRALSLPLWAFSSLAAAAAALDRSSLHPRCVLFDARSDRIYAAAYLMKETGTETLLEPFATTVGELLDGLVPPGALLMGDGALRHRALLEEAGHAVLPPPAGAPEARGLLRMLTSTPGASPVEDPGRWEPEYLRPPGVERVWKTSRGKGA